jgi:hypothetical protein
MKCLQIGISCRLFSQHAGTPRVHLWYARRIATSRDVFWHTFCGSAPELAKENALQARTESVLGQRPARGAHA